MKKSLLALAITLSITPAQAEELKKDKYYRARTNLYVTQPTPDDADNSQAEFIKVGAQSKFVVINNANKDKYTIKFMDIYKYSEFNSGSEDVIAEDEEPIILSSKVVKGEKYYLNKITREDEPVENEVEQSFGGMVSGPLIVPFKYRLDDKSIGGDATIGYYAGWGFDTDFRGISDTYVTFTPFLSAGLTQVSVLKETDDGSNDTETKSGFTWAAGILIKNWDSVNIGIVYGQDRIGDSTWKHEGEGWLSISIGWEL